MKSQHSNVPWNFRLGILGLALSASPLFTGIVIAGDKPATAPIAKKVDPADAVQPCGPEPVGPDPITDPLNKAAASRKPEGRITVNNLESTLEATYRNNTDLKELQAQVRSKDEGVPQALAGWRPTVYVNASIAGEKDILSGDIKEDGDNGITLPQSGKNFSTATAALQLKQNLYKGGGDVAATCQAESAVQAARALLADKEREILYNGVQAYFAIIARTAELEYRISNENSLKATLDATKSKFDVGEETRTSIAQAEASLASGTADREAAQAALLTAEATFEQWTGVRPGKLKKPGLPENLPTALKEAIEIAKKNHPAILAALHQEKADRAAIKVSDAELLPKVDLVGNVSRQGQNTAYNFATSSGRMVANDFTTAQSVAVNLAVPVYEAGAIRARSRGLREVAEQRRIQIETARRKIIQQLVEAWETYLAAKANVLSYKTQVKGNEVALEGTRQEMLVGSKILLDVLNAQRDLVNSQLNLVRAEQQLYQAAYSVLGNMGRLNALDLKLKVKRYNTQTHYHDVRNSW